MSRKHRNRNRNGRHQPAVQPAVDTTQQMIDQAGQVVGKTFGMMLLTRGLRRPGLFGAACAVGGLAMMFPGPFAGMCRNIFGAFNKQRFDAPTYAHEDEGHEAEQVPEDEVDAAVMASFPASDPSGTYHTPNRT